MVDMVWQSYYNQEEKADKLLPWHIEKIQFNRGINSIILKDRENLVDPEEINEVLTKYYKDLYKSEYPDNSHK